MECTGRSCLHPPGSPEDRVTIQLENGQTLLVPTDVLQLQKDGSYSLPFSLGVSSASHPSTDSNGDRIVVPVLVEELDVQKRKVETGRVRIVKTVHAREQVVDEPLLQEELDVQRVPIHRVADGPVPIRYEGDTMIVPLLEEVFVVEKRLMVKEELHITKHQKTVHRPERVIVRSEEVTVERLPVPPRVESGR